MSKMLDHLPQSNTSGITARISKGLSCKLETLMHSGPLWSDKLDRKDLRV